MLQGLFADLRQYLDDFFQTVDMQRVEQVFAKILACQGMIVVTGVGKSGHIAKKIAATLLSTGTRAVFLSTEHALHGDIGLLSSGDLLLALSKSGESEQLLTLLHFAKKKGAFLISILSSRHSRLAQVSDLSLYLPVQRELCPYDLVPTTSTIVQLIFGDCLAIALMRAKNVTVADFAANHPAGLLGRKITLTVADLMVKEEAIPRCAKQDRLIDVLHELTAKRSGCLLVLDRDQLEGIFTDGDLRRAIQTKGEGALQAQMAQLMTPTPSTIDSHELAITALRHMEANPQRPITVLPVLEKGQLIGLLRLHDILQAGLR